VSCRIKRELGALHTFHSVLLQVCRPLFLIQDVTVRAVSFYGVAPLTLFCSGLQGATCEPSSSFRCTLTFSHPDNAAEVEAVVGPAKQPPAKRQRGRDSSNLPDLLTQGGRTGLAYRRQYGHSTSQRSFFSRIETINRTSYKLSRTSSCFAAADPECSYVPLFLVTRQLWPLEKRRVANRRGRHFEAGGVPRCSAEGPGRPFCTRNEEKDAMALSAGKPSSVLRIVDPAATWCTYRSCSGGYCCGVLDFCLPM
jgi:hypothetical protein